MIILDTVNLKESIFPLNYQQNNISVVEVFDINQGNLKNFCLWMISGGLA